MLGSEVTRRWGAAGLPEDTIRLRFQGSAGQSFGAFLPPGISLELEGDANDYLGKGLSGGRISVFPPADAPFIAHENVIAGNVLLYGATAGEVFVRGIAGDQRMNAVGVGPGCIASGLAGEVAGRVQRHRVEPGGERTAAAVVADGSP